MLRVKTISIRVGKNHNEPANIVRAAQRGNPQLSSSAVISTHSSFQNDKEPKETTIRGRYEKFQIIQLWCNWLEHRVTTEWNRVDISRVETARLKTYPWAEVFTNVSQEHDMENSE